MPSLIGTEVTTNYLKTSPSTQFGTRALKFLVVTMGTGGDSDVDLTKQKYDNSVSDYVNTYAFSDSYFTRLVRAVQEYAEIFAVGTPTATAVTIVVAEDTANGSEPDSNIQATTFGAMEASIKAAMGFGNKAGGTTPYNGTVVVNYYSLQGSTLA